jgi:hypothetical protein
LKAVSKAERSPEQGWWSRPCGGRDVLAIALPMVISISLSAILIGWLGSGMGGELIWWWWVLTGWICALGVTFLARFLQGRWRTMRVIEHDTEVVEAESADTVVLATVD